MLWRSLFHTQMFNGCYDFHVIPYSIRAFHVIIICFSLFNIKNSIAYMCVSSSVQTSIRASWTEQKRKRRIPNIFAWNEVLDIFWKYSHRIYFSFWNPFFLPDQILWKSTKMVEVVCNITFVFLIVNLLCPVRCLPDIIRIGECSCCCCFSLMLSVCKHYFRPNNLYSFGMFCKFWFKCCLLFLSQCRRTFSQWWHWPRARFSVCCRENQSR